MRILQINKFHYLKDGASRSYFETARLLTEQGHEVAFFSMNHPDNFFTSWRKYFIDQVNYDNVKGWRATLQSSLKIIYNRQAVRNLEKLLKDFRPDVAHLHIIYHQLSPAIIRVLHKHHIPIVMTLHDYKLISPNYMLFNKGRISYKACGGKYYQVIYNKAIKNSYLKSILAAVEAYVHNRILKTYNLIDCFIAPSSFMKSMCTRYGIPAHKVVVLPHFIPPDFLNMQLKSESVRDDYLLYVGRLSEEKGIASLLRAIAILPAEIKLKVVGSGPQKKYLQSLTNELKLTDRVEFIGNTDSSTVAKLMQKARYTVVPSIWLEVFGYVALESLAQGTPVIASRIGALPEIIKDGINGFLFTSGDSQELAQTIKQAYKIVLDLQVQSQQISYKYSAQSHYQALLNLYRQLLDKNLIIF